MKGDEAVRHAPIAVLMLLAMVVPAEARKRTKPPRTARVEAARIDVLPETLEIAGPFSVHVTRKVASDAEARALAAAEAVAPGDSCRFEWLLGQYVPPDPQAWWWCVDTDGIRVARSVTGDAVRYYLGLSSSLREGRPTITIPLKRSNFTYDASVSQQESFVDETGHEHHDLFVVTLSLRWSDYCGLLCAHSFSKSRTVVVARNGSVLSVSGDGPPDNIGMS